MLGVWCRVLGRFSRRSVVCMLVVGEGLWDSLGVSDLPVPGVVDVPEPVEVPVVAVGGSDGVGVGAVVVDVAGVVRDRYGFAVGEPGWVPDYGPPFVAGPNPLDESRKLS